MTAGQQNLGGWPSTELARVLEIDFPIIQGPFGGGLSSPELAASVSEAGGLGSFGAHLLEPGEIGEVVAAIRHLTSRRFAINLWVSNHDVAEEDVDHEQLDAARASLAPLYEELGIEPPSYPERFSPLFTEQAEAMLSARPPVFSFVFGVPPADILDACRAQGIRTVGTATTPDEAVALEEAGVDAIVASGFEAGGHRGSFLDTAEASLTGTMPLVPVIADEVGVPVVAAGGIADGRGIAAALTLGAAGVQIGTAFLATEESNAPAIHRSLLFDRAARRTRLTRAYTGRLARGIPNRIVEALSAPEATIAPYPYQGYLVKPLRGPATEAGRDDLISLWAGQAAPLLRHRSARELFDSLVDEVGALAGSTSISDGARTPSGDAKEPTKGAS